MLVTAGADINYKKPKTHLTPLHWACFNGDKQVVRYLLDKGAKQQLSNLNQTPLGIAGVTENYDIVESILDHWWSKNSSLLVEGSPDFKAVSHTSEAFPIKISSGGPHGDKSSRIQPDFGDNKKIDDNERENSFGDLEGKKLIVRLKYDTTSTSRNFDVSFNFRILYWAAYLGR